MCAKGRRQRVKAGTRRRPSGHRQPVGTDACLRVQGEFLQASRFFGMVGPVRLGPTTYGLKRTLDLGSPTPAAADSCFGQANRPSSNVREPGRTATRTA